MRIVRCSEENGMSEDNEVHKGSEMMRIVR